MTDFDKYVSKCRYCLNSGLDLPDEPLFTDYVPDLIPVEEELNQESAAAGMTLEEYIKRISFQIIFQRRKTVNKHTKCSQKRPII